MDAQKIINRGFILKDELIEVMKDDMLRKVYLNCAEGNMGEGIWAALLTDTDLEKYNDDDSIGEEIACVLANSAIAYAPNETRGMVIKAKTRGTDRPFASIEENVEHIKECYDAYIEEWHKEWTEDNESGE